MNGLANGETVTIVTSKPHVCICFYVKAFLEIIYTLDSVLLKLSRSKGMLLSYQIKNEFVWWYFSTSRSKVKGKMGCADQVGLLFCFHNSVGEWHNFSRSHPWYTFICTRSSLVAFLGAHFCVGNCLILIESIHDMHLFRVVELTKSNGFGIFKIHPLVMVFNISKIHPWYTFNNIRTC